MSSWSDSDVRFMTFALELARTACAAGEVPVGALVVSAGEVLGKGWNRPIGGSDPTAHAEMEAIRAACRKLGNYRLPGSTLYASLEPCVMCAGAIVNARISRLVFAARDLRFGGVRSRFHLADHELLNHQVEVGEGLLAAESAELLQSFFSQRRAP